ncbi:ABC transporter substrate-binding protein [Candidatus Magnetominusculus xianensis]|uniref:Thiamine pyrimidine synthase n=1 Tax=Candidatus Magnetominusculus xianensis TaxID=1748249 RepID=A0ABR5SCE7_9BACT|nr:ABC transporter substrate-binding protein [Candidatus Magnetominusculus xianensis]KWT76846.1 ABC transporter substrate-binding protein [Candidatus Magnetominusculus xianensis]MBF0402648.1 ABC transporter substrate-binding protein [Nitrospirota bacterium]
MVQAAAAQVVYGEAGLKAASFATQWLPQAQFVGYYVALEKGIYTKHGIDLKIITGGPDDQVTALLENGKADFASMWLSTALRARAGGQKLLNIAQIVRRTSQMLVAKKKSGIVTPQDLNGKKISLWDGDASVQGLAFIKKHKLTVKLLNQSETVNLFMHGAVDAVSAMLYNEYHTILNSGVDPEELTTLSFYDYGINFPEDGLYVSEDRWVADPELCCAFVRASVEGWLYAFAHPDEAVDIVMKYMIKAHVPSNKAHQKWMFSKMKDLIIPDNDTAQTGILRQEDYERTAAELKADGETVTPFDSFYKNCVKK